LSERADCPGIGAILLKPGPLTETEREFVNRHTLIAERILLAAPSLTHIAAVVRSTHERFDGKGYPDGLAGEEIPLLALSSTRTSSERSKPCSSRTSGPAGPASRSPDPAPNGAGVRRPPYEGTLAGRAAPFTSR